jgi:hypothetical protein
MVFLASWVSLLVVMNLSLQVWDGLATYNAITAGRKASSVVPSSISSSSSGGIFRECFLEPGVPTAVLLNPDG